MFLNQKLGLILVLGMALMFIGTVWGIQRIDAYLANMGDPERMESITARVTEYAAGIDPTQSPEIHTWYFGKAHHYISEFLLVDAATGQTVEYMCSWPADMGEVDLSSICSGRPVEVEE